MRHKEKKKTTQRRGIKWGQLLCRENQVFIYLDLLSSHISINIRGVILATVYNDNSFSWFWLIGCGKEINSLILFYSISSTLCVISKLLLWLMCSLPLMDYDNKCIYHVRTKQIWSVMYLSYSIFTMIFFIHINFLWYACLATCLQCYIFQIPNSAVLWSLLGWAFYFTLFKIDLVGRV